MRTLAYGDDPDQVGDLFRPQGQGSRTGPWPVAMLLHGGYWRDRWGRGLMAGLAADLARRGFAAWNLEYRRVGHPSGGWPGTFDDVRAGLDALEGDDDLDLDRVALVGHSAGGQLALWLAAQPTGVTPRIVVALAPVADLHLAARLHLSDDAVVGLLGGTPDEHPDRYRRASPTALAPIGVPQVLLHGTADDDVPLALSRAHQAAAGDECTLLELPGTDHFALIDPASPAWALAAAHLTAALR